MCASWRDPARASPRRLVPCQPPHSHVRVPGQQHARPRKPGLAFAASSGDPFHAPCSEQPPPQAVLQTQLARSLVYSLGQRGSFVVGTSRALLRTLYIKGVAADCYYCIVNELSPATARHLLLCTGDREALRYSCRRGSARRLRYYSLPGAAKGSDSSPAVFPRSAATNTRF